MVAEGTSFTMQGGTIRNNRAVWGGAGVYVVRATFTMQGGRICDNVGLFGGGGVYVDVDATFTMQNGTISDNKVNRRGGGVYSNMTFIMQGGTICNNTAESGGGVFTNDKIYLQGGTICKNTATQNGAGVYVNHDTFAMDGGSINENNGEGVYTSDSWTKFEMYGGEIKGNTGIGVHCCWDFELSGAVSIGGNARDVVMQRRGYHSPIQQGRAMKSQIDGDKDIQGTALAGFYETENPASHIPGRCSRFSVSGRTATHKRFLELEVAANG